MSQESARRGTSPRPTTLLAGCAALSLLAAGCAALLGLAPLLRAGWGALRPARDAGALLRACLPLAALVAPLWLLPTGGRGAALLKLGTSALAYLAAMALAHWRSAGSGERAGERALARFVHMLLGGA